MDTIKAAIEPVGTVPPEFWYATSMILTALLIWVVQKYFASLQTTIREISESIKDLTKIVTRHDERLDQLENKNGNTKRRS